jgi:DNA-binding transcriptional ArsR family regulator
MLMCVYLMSATETGTVLGARLERLTGEDASCCVTGYQSLAVGVLGSARFRAAERRFKALGDENRLLVAALLKRRGELCACEIQAATGLTHATVSHHMSVLEEAGLVLSRRDGKWMYYRLAPGPKAGIP